MSKPQVTLTFAGDESKLSQSMQNVGASARTMSTDVGSASRSIGESAGGFDRAGEAADGAEGKAQGFSDTLTGTKDVMGGVGEIAKGNLFEGFVMAGQGMADLAGGMASFLIPALKNAGTWIKSTTIAQKAMNLAMRMNPIGIIITALVLLGIGLVALWKKSETFRRIVTGAFDAVKSFGQGALNWTKKNWPLLLAILTGPVGIAVLVIGKHKDAILGFFKSVPGKIAGFFKGVGSVVSAPFRAAFQGIKDAWNNTVGGKGFSVPGWIPGVGGKDFHIPYFHTGGIVGGNMGSETLAVLKAGEKVTGGSNSADGVGIVFRSDGTAASRAILELVRRAVQVEFGGDVQAAFS